MVGNDLNFDYVVVPPLTSKANSKKIVSKDSYIVRGTFAITSANKYPEATMRWVDYFYTKDGANLLSAGLEGENFDYVDPANKQGVIPRTVQGMAPNEYRGTLTPNAGTFVRASSRKKR